MTITEMSDPMCDDVPALVGGDTNADGRLNVGESWVYRCDHVVTEEDDDPVVNTAEVTGEDLARAARRAR